MAEADIPLSVQETYPSAASRSRKVPLRNLFLDPNNYRFIDQAEYVHVPVGKVTDHDVQRRTTGFLLGEGTDGIRDLLASLRKNGWLPIDQIQVREIARGKFLVVEGNRRVAALKYLQRRYEETATDLGALDPLFFDEIPVVLYDDASEAHHLVVMGLAHIAGKKKWPALNQARALRELIVKHGWSEEETHQALGIERRDLRRALGALALCDNYAAGEYGDQMAADKYNLFREVVTSPALRDWLGWDQITQHARNSQNLERLFSWISREGSESDDESLGTERSLDPVLSTGTDVRELSKLIHDEGALRSLDETRRLSEATFSSERVVEDRLSDGLRRVNDNIGVLFNHAEKLSEEHLVSAEAAMKKIHGLLTTRDRQPVLVGTPISHPPFNEVRGGHFSSLTLELYRRFRGLAITGLRTINLFVGSNNSGKTSILEAVQLLASQNDVTTLLEVVRRRGKIHGDPPPAWVSEQISEESRISGFFDTVQDNGAGVIIRNEQNGTNVEDKAFYISTIDIDAWYHGVHQTSVTHLFEQKERQTRFESCRVLCPAIFSSPFVQHETSFMAELFERSVKEGTKEEVVDFLRSHLDTGIKDIEQTGTTQSLRFRLIHEHITPSPDLTQFGEGLQRIFHIGLLFAYARNGIVLIDEFENAIHFELLLEFTKLVQQLATRFNVQVFLSTHSKECVDAFVRNDFRLGDISAYAVRGIGLEATCYHYPGEKLQRLLDSMNIDLRS